MRDLLDKIQTLFESTGLAGRKPGDTFKNSEGEKITFNSIDFYPNQGGKLESKQLDQEIKKLQSTTQIIWQNKKTAKTGGFIIATFDSEQGPKYFGFFKDNIKPNKTDNYVPNEVSGFRFAGKTAEKIQSGLTPQDLLTQRDNLTSQQIIQQLSNKLGSNNPLVKIALRVANGEEFPLSFPAPQDVSFTGFRDYFCEILQPMALQTGQYTGNAGEAAEIFLGGSFSDTLISFDAAKNAGLSDSIMSNNQGKSVKISTKGGYGAQASAKNLVDSIDELSQTPAGKKLLKKYKETIDLVREIQKRGQVDAPLWLAVEYNIITDKEAEKIKSLRGSGPINLNDVKQLNLGKNLTKLALERNTDTPEKTNLFYHLMAAVAFKAADKVNTETDFSDAASDILNNGALVQVYTTLKESQGNWILEPFKTVYPGKSIQGVNLSASKNYFSTQIKGNFTFKINPKGKEKDTSTTDKVSSVDDLAKIAKQVVDRPKRSFTKKQTEPNKGVGRAKRK